MRITMADGQSASAGHVAITIPISLPSESVPTSFTISSGRMRITILRNTRAMEEGKRIPDASAHGNELRGFQVGQSRLATA